MTQPSGKAPLFRSLHVPGKPLILHNVWDAGGAGIVARAGASAIATSSWAIAAAQGYEDGEALPLDAALAIIGRIAACMDLPVTADFEGGYAAEPERVASNVARLMALGVVGLNFEDQVVGGHGLYPVADQVARLQAVRAVADGSDAFINARTDLFLQAEPAVHAALMPEALARAAAYAAAGADGFFVPGLSDPVLVRDLCHQVSLPVNVMLGGGPFSNTAALGVARISLGAAPYLAAMATLRVGLDKP